MKTSSSKVFQFSVAGDNTEAASWAINYLNQIYPGEFEQFAKSCWKSAWAHLLIQFPETWPTPR
jgi:hypothetical protein